MSVFNIIYIVFSFYLIVGLIVVWLLRRSNRKIFGSPGSTSESIAYFTFWPVHASEVFFMVKQEISYIGVQKNARKLLLSLLNPEEEKEFYTKGTITIYDGSFMYIVRSQAGRPVVFYDFGLRQAKDAVRHECIADHQVGLYCMLFVDPFLPDDDEIAMKVALLKTDPESFRTKANFMEFNLPVLYR